MSTTRKELLDSLMQPLSPQSIDAIAETISGGSFSDSGPKVGHYRSGPKLERFFASLNIELSIGNRSRVPAVIEKLKELNWSEPYDLIRVIEAVCNLADYLDDRQKHAAVVNYLNKRLAFDGLEVRQVGQKYNVVVVATATVVTAAFEEAASKIDYASVESDLNRCKRRPKTLAPGGAKV